MTRPKDESKMAEAYRWANREGYKAGPAAARVLVELLTYTELETGICYPKQDTMARNMYDTNAPSKAQTNVISKAVSALQRARLLTVQQTTHRGQKSVNFYVLNIGDRAHCEWERLPSPSGSGDHLRVGAAVPTASGNQEVSSGSIQGSIQQKRGRKSRHLKAVD